MTTFEPGVVKVGDHVKGTTNNNQPFDFVVESLGANFPWETLLRAENVEVYLSHEGDTYPDYAFNVKTLTIVREETVAPVPEPYFPQVGDVLEPNRTLGHAVSTVSNCGNYGRFEPGDFTISADTSLVVGLGEMTHDEALAALWDLAKGN